MIAIKVSMILKIIDFMNYLSRKIAHWKKSILETVYVMFFPDQKN